MRYPVELTKDPSPLPKVPRSVRGLTSLALAAVIGSAFLGALGIETTTASPGPIPPGIDLWMTTAGGTAFWDFSDDALPADFFGPGSDPFDGIVAVRGVPLPNMGGPSLFPADTVVERLEPVNLPVGSSDTISIEIRALSLASTDPIVVTYNGGMSPELWNVEVGLSSSYSQAVGAMTIRQDCVAGGTFSATLPVQPKFIFIRQSDMMLMVMDPGNARTFTVANGRWVHGPDPTFLVVRVLPGAVTDGNLDGVPDSPLPGTTDSFAAGLWPLPCNPTGDSPQQWMRLTPLTATRAAHGVIIAHGVVFTDSDLDWMPNIADNCRSDANPLQEDSDDNGLGDVCQSQNYLPLVLRDY